jgi:hypothetical protein
MTRELRDFSRFFGTRRELFPDDETYVHEALARLVSDHVVFVGEENAEAVGFIVGMIQPHIFNPAIRVLTELFWWVAPEHRQARVGGLLFLEFVKWGKANADWITMALEEKSPVSETSLTERGFRRWESSYLLECE